MLRAGAGPNIDPEAAAESYRTRVLEQLGPEVNVSERSTVREQLSGACTTEIAAFDEFVGLLDGDMAGFDHIISIRPRLAILCDCLASQRHGPAFYRTMTGGHPVSVHIQV